MKQTQQKIGTKTSFIDPKGYYRYAVRNNSYSKNLLTSDQQKKRKFSRKLVLKDIDDDLNVFWEYAHMQDVCWFKHYKRHNILYLMCYFYQGFATSTVAEAIHFNSRYLSYRSNFKVDQDNWTQLEKILEMFIIGINLTVFITLLTFRRRIYISMALASLTLIYVIVVQILNLNEYDDFQDKGVFYLTGCVGCCLIVIAERLIFVTLCTMSINLSIWSYCFFVIGMQISTVINFWVAKWLYTQMIENHGLTTIKILMVVIVWMLLLAQFFICFNYIDKKRERYVEIYDTLNLMEFNWDNLVSLLKRIDQTVFFYTISQVLSNMLSYYIDDAFKKVHSEKEIIEENLDHFLYDNFGIVQQTLMHVNCVFAIAPLIIAPFFKMKGKRKFILSGAFVIFNIAVFVITKGFVINLREYGSPEYGSEIIILVIYASNKFLVGILEYYAYNSIFNSNKIVKDEKEIAINVICFQQSLDWAIGIGFYISTN